MQAPAFNAKVAYALTTDCFGRGKSVSPIADLDRGGKRGKVRTNEEFGPMRKRSVMAEEHSQKAPATLGDVLYARCKIPVPEQDWAMLVQSIAAGDQPRCMRCTRGHIASSSL